MPAACSVTVILLFSCLLSLSALAQETPPAAQPQQDSTRQGENSALKVAPVPGDTTLNAPPDSAAVAEADTLGARQTGDIETTIDYFAEDSIFYDVLTGTVYLFGNARVVYGDMQIEAARITFDVANNTVRATSAEDSTGQKIGVPVFTESGQTYNADDMTYNIKTRRGVIKGIVTQQGEGYIVSEKVKKTPDDELYAASNIYTTCNYEHPHFGINARKLKIVPGKYVIAGPFNLELNDTPLPLGFAFGLFPFSDTRAAGIIVPTYGEDRNTGFYLRNGGFYVPLGDYADLEVLGQIYTLGSWGVTVNSRYKVRYRFDGNLGFSYAKRVVEENSGEESVSTDYWLRWSHRPQTRGTGRFSASVNVGSRNYNRNNSFSTTDFISASFNSSVSYSKVFEGSPFSFGSNLRINQNVTTGVTTMFPEVNFAMRRIFPFKGPSAKRNNPLAQLNFSYNFNGRANVTNDTVPQIRFQFPVAGTPARPVAGEVPIDPDTGQPVEAENELPDFFGNFFDLLDGVQYGAVHRIPVSTNLTFLKFFQLTPNLNYTEYWYPQKFNYSYVESERAVKVDTIPGFARAYEWNTGVSLNTRLYAFYYPKLPGLQGIRHMITPNLSFTYRPDFSDPSLGFYQPLQTSADGENFRRFSRFAGALYGTPGQGLSSAMSFGLDNQFEAKIITKPDSTGKVETRKVPVLQNLSFRSAYNFAADSFRLSNINFSTRAQILKNVPFIKGVSLNFNGTIDPYTYEIESVTENNDGTLRVNDRRVDRYAWQTGNGIGRLSNFSINASTSFGPERKKNSTPAKRAGNQAEEAELEFIENNPDLYVDFNVPWSLRVQYNMRYSKQGFDEARLVQTLNFSGEVNLTENWKVGFRSSYDFELQNFGFTSLNVYRDLHCWQMNLSWVPFGPRQSYNIDIRVRSSILQDLKLSKRNTWFDRGANFRR